MQATCRQRRWPHRTGAAQRCPVAIAAETSPSRCSARLHACPLRNSSYASTSQQLTSCLLALLLHACRRRLRHLPYLSRKDIEFITSAVNKGGAPACDPSRCRRPAIYGRLFWPMWRMRVMRATVLTLAHLDCPSGRGHHLLHPTCTPPAHHV